MSKIRVRYSKTGKAKYISHLDLMATMQRAFIRAGVRLKYSEGFNPHPYISVALPLPVGCGSVCELMDVGLMDVGLMDIGLMGIGQKGDFADRINASLPDGLYINEVYVSERKFSEIAWIQIDGILAYDDGAPPGAAERLAEHFSRGSIIIQKKTKRGTADIDVAPHIRDIGFEYAGEGLGEGPSEGLGERAGKGPGERASGGPGERADEGRGKCTSESPNEIRLTARISAIDPTINAGDVMSVIRSGPASLRPDFSAFTRLEVFDKSLTKFR